MTSFDLSIVAVGERAVGRRALGVDDALSHFVAGSFVIQYTFFTRESVSSIRFASKDLTTCPFRLVDEINQVSIRVWFARSCGRFSFRVAFGLIQATQTHCFYS